VKELGQADEVLDLSDYERCEEIRKNKSRSKKSHSKFRLHHSSSPGNTVPNLVFLAMSPEEKESWINILNTAITRAKNLILDEVMVEDSQLSHLTRDRVKIPHNRRLPTRGHLLAVVSQELSQNQVSVTHLLFVCQASTSSSDGMLTLDLIQEEVAPSHKGVSTEDSNKSMSQLSPDCPRSQTDGALSDWTTELSTKSQSLPRETVVWQRTGLSQTPQPDKRLSTTEKNRCSSMDEILNHSETKAAKNKISLTSRSSASTPTGTTMPISQLQELISQKLEKTERLLMKVRSDGDAGKGGKQSTDGAHTEAERLLKEAAAAWNQAREVLEEVKELKALYRQLDPSYSTSPSNSTKINPNRKSLI
ncbi:hypothetical protein GOODEAATRI_022338, partial [Goodea atripinnis]